MHLGKGAPFLVHPELLTKFVDGLLRETCGNSAPYWPRRGLKGRFNAGEMQSEHEFPHHSPLYGPFTR